MTLLDMCVAGLVVGTIGFLFAMALREIDEYRRDVEYRKSEDDESNWHDSDDLPPPSALNGAAL